MAARHLNLDAKWEEDSVHDAKHVDSKENSGGLDPMHGPDVNKQVHINT